VIGEALEQMRFVHADIEMVKLHLRLGPGKRGRALERHRFVMLVGEVEHSSRVAAAIVQNAMRTVAPRGIRTRRRRLKIGSSTAPAVLDKRPAVGNGGGVRMVWPRPRKARAIGLELNVA
jgi:hypothetical protein